MLCILPEPLSKYTYTLIKFYTTFTSSRINKMIDNEFHDARSPRAYTDGLELGQAWFGVCNAMLRIRQEHNKLIDFI